MPLVILLYLYKFRFILFRPNSTGATGTSLRIRSQNNGWHLSEKKQFLLWIHRILYNLVLILFKICSVKVIFYGQDWVKLAVNRARASGARAVFWLDPSRWELFTSNQCWGSVTFWCGSGSVPLANVSGSGSGSNSRSDSFFQWLKRCKKKFIFFSYNVPTGISSSALKI